MRNLCAIHHSWWNSPLMVFGLHGCRPIYRFEASAVKAMRPMLTREFSFQLIFGICTLLRSQYWKYNIPIRCSRFFTVTSIMVSKWTYLKKRVSKECFLHVCHPGIVIPILSSHVVSLREEASQINKQLDQPMRLGRCVTFKSNDTDTQTLHVHNALK